MEEFLRTIGLPYPRNFVCASIQPVANHDTRGSGVQPPICSANSYGQPHVLRPEFAERATVACAGDFQNVMTTAYLGYLHDGIPFSEYKQYFWDLRNLDEASRSDHISKAHRRVVELGKKFGEYAEVRLPGPAFAVWSDTKRISVDHLSCPRPIMKSSTNMRSKTTRGKLLRESETQAWSWTPSRSLQKRLLRFLRFRSIGCCACSTA
jgi:hypothetical protein